MAVDLSVFDEPKAAPEEKPPLDLSVFDPQEAEAAQPEAMTRTSEQVSEKEVSNDTKLDLSGFDKATAKPEVPLEQHPFVLNTLADDRLTEDQQKAVIERYGERYEKAYGADTNALDSFKVNFRNSWDNFNTIGSTIRRKNLGGDILQATGAAEDFAKKQTLALQEKELEQRKARKKKEPGALERFLGTIAQVNMVGLPTIGDPTAKKTKDLEREVAARKKAMKREEAEGKENRFEGLLTEAEKQAEFAALDSEGFLENTAAVTGALGGALVDPVNVVPMAKPVQGAGLATKLGVRAAEGAAVNAAINSGLQAGAIEANQQEGFEWGQFFADTGLGGLGTGAFTLLGDAGGRLLARYGVDPSKVKGKTVDEALDTIRNESGESAEDLAKVIDVEINNPELKAQINRRVAKETLVDEESLPQALRRQGDEGAPPEPSVTNRNPPPRVEAGEPRLSAEEIEKLPKVERDLINERPKLANEKSLEQIRKRTRGVVTDQEAIAKAKELDWSEEKIANIKQGQTLNKEQVLATKGVVLEHTQRLQAMRAKLRDLDPDSGEAALLRAQVAAHNVENVALWQTQRAVAAETGRALQSFKVNMEPINVAMNRVAKVLNDPKLPKDAKDYLVKAVADADGDADEVLSLLRQIPRASKMEMLVEMATAMKLSGKQTQIVNLITSKARQAVLVAEDMAGAAFDAAESAITRKPRERFLTEAFAESMGMVEGYKAVPYHLKRLLTDEEYALRMRSNQDFYNGKAPAIRGRFGKNTLYDQLLDVAGSVIRLPFRGLSVGDIIVRSPVEMGAPYRLAARDAAKKGLKFNSAEWKDHVANFITEPDGDTMAAIKDAGNRATFQRDPESVFLRKLSEVRAATPATKLVIPFFRTLNDLIKTGFEFSPAAPVLKNVRRQLVTKGERADALGRMAMGTTLWMAMTQYAAEGNITGAPPRTKAERDKWERTGKQPYSVKIGGKWVAYNRVAPFSYFLASAESMNRALQNDDQASALDQMAGFTGEMGQMLIDQNFMLGVSDLLEALQEPERKGARFLENLIVGATYPNLLAEEARAVDPVIRDVKSDKEGVAGFFDQLANAYKARIPFSSKSLPPQMNVWGEPRERPGLSYAERSWNPLRISQPHVDIVESELDALGYVPGFPGKKAFGFDMSNEQYRQLQEVAGDAAYRVLFNLIPMQEYQSLNPMQREGLVNQVFNGVRQPARLLAAPQNYVDSITVQYLRQVQGMTSDQAKETLEAERRER